MLTIDDFIGMCGCTEEEIDAIAMHEHVPDAVASEMANYLINSTDGVPRIRKIILEDIETAKHQGHTEQVKQLNEVLNHFVAAHRDQYQNKGRVSLRCSAAF